MVPGSAVNGTTDEYTGTPCILISVDYNKIRCRVGVVKPMTGGFPVVVDVDGQQAIGYISDERLKAAKKAVDSGTFTEDDNTTVVLKNARDVRFKTQVDKCVVMSNGLTDSLKAMNVTKSNPDDFELIKKWRWPFIKV